MERIFIGRQQPMLPGAARILRERYADSSIWDMSRVIVVLPGGQAARRLRRLLYDEAVSANLTLKAEPNVVTPAALLELLHTPAQTIAGRMQSFFGWIVAVGRLSAEDQAVLAPKAARSENALLRAGVAHEAQRARDASTTEGLTLQTIADQCAALPEVCDDRRWSALARLESLYLETLTEAGLSDRDQSRMAALKHGQIACDKDIYLVGDQDLNGLGRAMLGTLTSTVVAVIPAPESEQEKFCEDGSLRVDRWHDTPIEIPDGILQFVEGPAEEAEALRNAVASLDGKYALEEITVGIGDEATAESLARWLAVLGLPSFSPFGRSLSRVRPAALLGAVRDFLHTPTAHTFAALIRHPDMESKLELHLLTSLDIYRAECLPAKLPTGGSDDPSIAQVPRESVAYAHDAVQALLAPLLTPKKPLDQWAKPIITLLHTVYADIQTSDDAEGRQLTRGLTGLQEILQSLKDLPSALSPIVSGADALAFLLGQAEAVRLPSEPDSGVGTEMMRWLDLALDDALVLLLTGLHEGCVPENIGDDSLLPNSLRQKLGLADDRRREVRDGLLLRQMIESRQTEGRCVRLIVPRRGADGDPRLPSRLLFACTPKEAAHRARKLTERTQDAPAALSLFPAGITRNLMPPQPVPLDLPMNEMSVSAFATYLACPYRFYLGHVLKLEEQDDSLSEMDPRHFGDLLHDCLNAFARSEAAQSAKVAVIQGYLLNRLTAQSKKRFGAAPNRAIQMQINQARRRLNAFAEWQANSVLEGWMIEPDLSEKPLTARIEVDGQFFTITGRPDRVDYQGATNQFRIIDYKTGDSARGPDEKHRKRDSQTSELRWTELQLPLYRVLMSQNKIPIDQIGLGEMGYVLLSADLTPISFTERGKRSGGTGFVPVSWAESDYESALECAHGVIRNVRAGVFWPPAAPPPFPPSRTDPGSADIFGGLCLDSSSDRAEWLGTGKENAK
ncbi:MAG: PD-(D/E)XK nuclease family protein [Janthinobacterium lividum]